MEIPRIDPLGEAGDSANPLHTRGEVTRILSEPRSARTPDQSGRLLELVYEQLHRLAQARMRAERVDHTLQPTALVHEAYARLVDANLSWNDKGHFFAAAAEAMRRVLVEHARAKGRVKRGGETRRVPLDLLELARSEDGAAILSVDEAFGRLQAMDADLACVVQLRFFAGLSEEETALALGVSDRTVRRDWTVARAWLRRYLDEQARADDSP